MSASELLGLANKLQEEGNTEQAFIFYLKTLESSVRSLRTRDTSQIPLAREALDRLSALDIQPDTNLDFAVPISSLAAERARHAREYNRLQALYQQAVQEGAELQDLRKQSEAVALVQKRLQELDGAAMSVQTCGLVWSPAVIARHLAHLQHSLFCSVDLHQMLHNPSHVLSVGAKRVLDMYEFLVQILAQAVMTAQPLSQRSDMASGQRAVVEKLLAVMAESYSKYGDLATTCVILEVVSNIQAEEPDILLGLPKTALHVFDQVKAAVASDDVQVHHALVQQMLDIHPNMPCTPYIYPFILGTRHIYRNYTIGTNRDRELVLTEFGSKRVNDWLDSLQKAQVLDVGKDVDPTILHWLLTRVYYPLVGSDRHAFWKSACIEITRMHELQMKHRKLEEERQQRIRDEENAKMAKEEELLSALNQIVTPTKSIRFEGKRDAAENVIETVGDAGPTVGTAQPSLATAQANSESEAERKLRERLNALGLNPNKK